MNVDSFAQTRKSTQPAPSFVPFETPVFRKDSFNIISYGAKADGMTLNTEAITKAINDCNQKGGGVVVVPPGAWMTGPIVLKSNVQLHLAANSLLQFTADKSQYKLVEGNWEGQPSPRNQSPISAVNAENIAITGSGIIDGNGDAWRALKKEKTTNTQWKRLIESGGILSEDKKTWYPSASYMLGADTKGAAKLADDKKLSDYESMKDFFRPNMVLLKNCKNILLEGVTFQNSPAWNLHPFMCENLTVRDVYAKNPWYAQNGDGIDVESCKNVLIENSTFDVGDDGICVKSGRDEAGRKRGMPTENMKVSNCTVYHAHGGFVIGSEMSGGARNIFVSDCTFIGTDIGLRFKTTRGRGGIVENIYIDNIVMKDIVGDAILFDMYYEAKDPVVLNGEKREEPKVETFPVTEATPVFKDFYIKNVVCMGAERAVFMRGLPEMNVRNINMKNMVLQAKKGIEITEGQDISFKNVQVLTANTTPIVAINNSGKIMFNDLTYGDNAELLFDIKGEKTSGIVVMKTDVTKAKNKATFTNGATEKALSNQK